MDQMKPINEMNAPAASSAEKKLEVKDLRISFRTNDGKGQAVRGISFDLYKGETLAIVGESGSGKSVTSKAVLGILAGNSIIEGGEIIYDGMDLLKIGEEDFHRIRGDKIAMIFQDPLSSLNPIVKIGKQLTEAMVLKGKARQKESKKNFNGMLKLLGESMVAAEAPNDAARANELTAKCQKFDKFEYKHIELESAFNTAHDAAVEAASDLENLIFELGKKAEKDVAYRVNLISKRAKTAIHPYVVDEKKDQLLSLTSGLSGMVRSARKSGDYSELIEKLTGVKSILDEALAYPMPNFFSMGYCLTFGKEALPEGSVEEINAYTRQKLDDDFMLDFISDAKQGLIWSADRSVEAMKKAVTDLRTAVPTFGKEELDKSECNALCKELTAAVDATIDKLRIVKDSRAYTFGSALRTEIDRFFGGKVKNAKEEKRYTSQMEKYHALEEKGKTPDWKVVPASYTDLDQVRANIRSQLERMADHFEEEIAARETRDFDAETVGVIDYLKTNASGVVNKVTQRMAKEKALKLMEEVGIAEPRKRYNQYPFEFSGGMRQRIVIAIALAANPDILICDEPTTALDVTIQAQILELINKLKKERNISVIFITHDLGVVANMADRVAVMYAGKIVEYGTAMDIFYQSAHPYTWALLSSMPDLDTSEKLDAIPGTPPSIIYPPVGDAFAARNKYALKIDFEMEPPLFRISDTHYAATWLLHPNAPKVEPPRIVTERIARMEQKRKEAEDGKQQ